MRQRLFYLTALVMLSSCISYHYSNENGISVKNAKRFTYNKPRFTNRDKFPLETNAIYIIDSQYSKWNDISYSRKNTEFVRFFPTGQVLFAYSKDTALLDLANNRNIGIPGYYIVEGDKIKISIFNRDMMFHKSRCLGKILANGDIMFYDDEIGPLASFRGVEKKSGRQSFWRKTKSEKIIDYTPDW